MTIPRTVDDLTPEWCSDALGRDDHGGRCRRRSVSASGSSASCTGSSSTVPTGAPTVVAKLAAPDRRGPLRRDGAQHVRPRGRLLQRALEAHDDRASGVSTSPSTIPRRRTRCCCSKTCRRAAACSIRSTGARSPTRARRSARSRSCTRASGTTRRSTSADFCCDCATTRIRARSRSRTTPRGRACRSSFPS